MNNDIKGFINDLYSDKPAPGGGGVAALVSSLGAAVCGMAMNLSVDKKAFKELDQGIQEKFNGALARLNTLKDDILEFIDKDADAFNGFMDALSLAKNTEEEIEIRKEALQMGYKDAMNVPLELLKRTIGVYDALELAADYGNINLVSDVAVGNLCISSAIRSCVINVKVNLYGIKDEAFKTKAESELLELIKYNDEKSKEIQEKCKVKLGFSY